MDFPPGIHATSEEGVVCKLQKSLYGWKQSPRAWFERFAASMKQFGYDKATQTTPCFSSIIKVVIAIIHNPIQHDRTKHVEVDQHFVKEKLDDGIIAFPFMNSEYQLADVLTKTVATTIFLNSLDKLGMRDIFAPT
ncbi:unnamed protein product [Prunus armeniaca]